MKYTIYNPDHGQIISVLEISDELSFINVVDKLYIEGTYSSQDYYIDVDTKEPVSKGARPNVNATWSYENRTWVANTNKDIEDARTQRNILLLAVDRVNPIWYGTLTQEQHAELATYRQALLDVPAQTGFPNTINWPIKPSWL